MRMGIKRNLPEDEIVREYNDGIGSTTLALKYACDKGVITRCLKRRGIEVTKTGKKRPPFSEEWKQKIASAGLNRKASKETNAKRSASLKKYFGKEEVRHGLSERAKKQWKSPEFRASMTGKNNPMHRPEVRAKVTGENCWLWKGGLSSEPYCHRFNEGLRERIRGDFGRTCYICAKSEEANGEHLAVHHVDYQKSQGCKGQKWSLIPLCHACHNRTNHNRWHWFALLRDYWIYDHINFFNF